MMGQAHSHWHTSHVTAVTLVAVLLPLIVTIILRGPTIIAPIGLALGLSLAWSIVFSAIRKSPINWHTLVSALVFVLFLPVATPVWQSGIALSFGLVFGDLIFGSRGRGFLNAAVVALAFLLFSFPASQPEVAPTQVAVAAGLSGMFLLVFGLLSWRIITGFGICIAVLPALLPISAHWQTVNSATIVLGLVFLIGDPVAGASTHLGRWLYGALAAALVVVLGQTGTGIGALPSIVFGALLASIFAPLLDQIAVYANVCRRAKRHTYEA